MSTARWSSSRVRGGARREPGRSLSFPAGSKRAARRPYDPPDRPATRCGRRRTRDAGGDRSVGGSRRAGAGGDRFRRPGRRTAGDRWALRPLPGGDQKPVHDGAQHATAAAYHRFGARRPRPRALALGRLDGGQGLPQGEAPAGHLASGRWRPHASALQLRDGRRRGRHCHRVIRICRRACRNALPHASQASQNRARRNGSLKTSAGTGERAQGVGCSRKLGCRGA
jgi:hypothetical protein